MSKIPLVPTLKETTLEVIKRLPESCSLEDIMFEMNMTAQVMEGLADKENGDTISTEQLLAKIEQWRHK